MIQPSLAPQTPPPLPPSEKELLAGMISKYIAHSEQVAMHSEKNYYHSLAFLKHQDGVRMVKQIAKNIHRHTMSELKLFAINALPHMEGLLPLPTNSSYQSSSKKLYEIKQKLHG